MKKTNHFYRFCALALSCLLLISLLPVTQVLADGDGAIHIKSARLTIPRAFLHARFLVAR